MTNKTKLHVGRPNIGNRECFLERVNGILDRRWLSNDGPVVQEFEKKVADLLRRSLFLRLATLKILWRLECPYVKSNGIW
jgi:dTDP-4-amino-4,6-dideoxygalactose transaminase